jgi:1,4-alpha-glucan branching enzyme
VQAIGNLTPVPRYGYRVGLPQGGRWRVLLNSDALTYGGSGIDVGPTFEAEDREWHGLGHSAVLTLPPLGVVWLAPEV